MKNVPSGFTGRLGRGSKGTAESRQEGLSGSSTILEWVLSVNQHISLNICGLSLGEKKSFILLFTMCPLFLQLVACLYSSLEKNHSWWILDYFEHVFGPKIEF